MSEALSDRAKAANAALGHLQRTVRFYRLYPHDHRFCVQSLGEAFTSLGEFHKAHGPLAVEVGHDGLFLDEELVLPEGESKNDLVQLFYFEAIREVTLDLGMPKEELVVLVRILSARYPEGGKDTFADDLTTALWREDLKFFAYQTHDPLSADAVRRNKGEAGVMAALAQRIRGIVESLGGSLKPPEPKPPGAAGEDEPQDADSFLAKMSEEEQATDDEADWETRPDRALAFLETDKGRERKRLVDELSRLGGDDVTRAAEVVAWSVNAQHPSVRDEDAARFLSGSALHALADGDVEQATRMASFATQASQEGSKVASLVQARLSSEEGIEALSQSLSGKANRVTAKKLGELGRSYLAGLGKSAVAGACTFYPSVEDVRVRRILRDFLTTHLDTESDSIAQLARHPNQTVASDVLNLLGSQGVESPAFQALKRLADDRFRPAAEKVLELTGEGERRRRVQAVCNGVSKNDRMLALAALQKTPAASTFADLSHLVKDDSLHGRDDEEIGALLDLLVACDRLGSRVLFTQVEERKVPLLRGRADTLRLKQSASDRLKSLGQERAP